MKRFTPLSLRYMRLVMKYLLSVISRVEIPSMMKYTLTPSSTFLSRIWKIGSSDGQEEPRKVERRI